MTPQQLEQIRTDVDSLDDEDALAATFYATLFDLDPDVRPLFPEDMEAQRTKLMTELKALVDIGVRIADAGPDRFVSRASSLGARHRTYGVKANHYETVGLALVAALRSHVRGWDDDRERSWRLLYALVADTMQEQAPPAVSASS